MPKLNKSIGYWERPCCEAWAKFKANVFWLFHWASEVRVETDTPYRYRNGSRPEIVTFVGVIKGTTIIREYYGESSLDKIT
jgi:hypothetical protein